MAEVPAQPPPSVPSAERAVEVAPRVVAVEISCVHCNYDLRGISIDGTCPECSTPVKHSLGKTFLLKHASPQYIARLYWGSILVLATWAWFIFGHMLDLYWIVLGAPFRWIAVTAFYVESVCYFVYLVGWWLLSSPLTQQLDRSPRGSGRTLVRITVLFVSCAAMFRVALQLPEMLPWGFSYSAFEVLYSFSGTIRAACMIGMGSLFFASTLYLGELGHRIPSRPVVAWSSTLLWFAPLLYSLGFVARMGPLPEMVNNVLAFTLLIAACAFCLMLNYWLYAGLRAIRTNSKALLR